MKSIKELKNPDVVTINGEKFQVIENTSLSYHVDKKELEMVVELMKVGETQMTPSFRLAYIYERPTEMKFFTYNKKKKLFEKIDLFSHDF